MVAKFDSCYDSCCSDFLICFVVLIENKHTKFDCTKGLSCLRFTHYKGNKSVSLILPLCCLFNPECHELARGIYIIREVYIVMFVIRIIQLTIAFNHSYHTCKFDIDWISILLKISKINANFDFIAACSSSPSLLLLPFASCS